jgi:Kef-type K+ transport system membrane component KefB
MPVVVSEELSYVILLFALFVLPRFLQRFRVPTPVTCVLLGVAVGIGLNWFARDTTIQMMSSLGITSLFLFAGLDVDFKEMHQERRILLQHVILMLASLAGVAWFIASVFSLPLQAAVLVALALLTPSAGFILESLRQFATTQQERFWIRSLAIGSELVALGVFFVTLQSSSVSQLGFSLLALILLVGLVPLVFWLFAKTVVRYAPKSEFAFLLMVALLSAYVTRELGVYYLVGAFVVGVVAQQFRRRLPSLVSEHMLHAVEVFASFFIPIYFFNAGLHVQSSDLGYAAVWIGGAFLLMVVPIRLFLTAVHRRFALGERWRYTSRIGIAILPTLVFSIVIAEILRERFQIASELFGGIIIYALVNTLLPAFVFKLPSPELDTAKAVAEASEMTAVDRLNEIA